MPMGGSFPVSDWMKAEIETRTQRIKRKERERVLNEVLSRLDIPDKRKLGWYRIRRIIENMK